LGHATRDGLSEERALYPGPPLKEGGVRKRDGRGGEGKEGKGGELCSCKFSLKIP